MAIVTTYVCDITAQSGNNRSDFVTVTINAQWSSPQGFSNAAPKIEKLVHKDVAVKLGLVPAKAFDAKAPIVPEVTFEGKLKALLEDYVADIVQDHLANQ